MIPQGEMGLVCWNKRLCLVTENVAGTAFFVSENKGTDS